MDLFSLFCSRTMTLLHTLRHKSPVSALALTQDGKEVITGTRDNVVYQWDLKTAKVLHTHREHIPPHQITAVACSHDNQQFASGGRDSFVVIYNRAGKKIGMLKKGHRTYVTSVAFDKSNNHIFSAGVINRKRVK